MSARNREGRHAGRGLVLAVEGLEPRELLSYYAALYARNHAAISPRALPAHLDFAPATTGSAPTETTPTATVSAAGVQPRITPLLRELVALNYPPGTPQPTNHEIIREAFSAKFSGEYTTGPGRFDDQAMTISLSGFGGANFSFHTNMQGVIYTPVNPTTSSATGLFTLFPRNVLTSGATFSFDLAATSADAHGLPNEFMAVSDQGQSGGIALAGGATPSGTGVSGKGIAKITYFPERSHNGFSSGRFVASIATLFYTSGTLSPIGTKGNLPGPFALQPNALTTPGTVR
jgi:hypothetical protein